MIELLIAAAILGILFAVIPSMFGGVLTNARLGMVRLKLQGDARNAVTTMQKRIRTATATSVVVDRMNATQPPFSRVEFVTVNGSTVAYWQDGRRLWNRDNGRERLLCDAVRAVSFTFPELNDPSAMHIALTLEENVLGRTKAIQLASEPVRVMNQ